MISRNIENTFVRAYRTTQPTLTPDELRDINSLFVKLGIIGGCVRSHGKSDVWKYYELGKTFSRGPS